MSERLNNNPNTTGDPAPTGWDKLAEMAPSASHDVLPPMPTNEPESALPDHITQADAVKNNIHQHTGSPDNAEKIKATPTPTQKFYQDIFGRLPNQDINAEDIPELIDAINSYFPEREVHMVQMRYGIGYDKRILREIGEEFELGRERPRQIVSKVIRQLKSPERSQKIELLFMTRAELRERIGELETQIAAAGVEPEIAENTAVEVGEVPSSPFIEELQAGQPNDISVDHLGLSLRGTNCLKRAGIETFGVLRTKTIDDLIKVRNLGRKAAEEVLARVAEINLLLENSKHGD